jgi:hypothetical protein
MWRLVGGGYYYLESRQDLGDLGTTGDVVTWWVMGETNPARQGRGDFVSTVCSPAPLRSLMSRRLAIRRRVDPSMALRGKILQRVQWLRG